MVNIVNKMKFNNLLFNMLKSKTAMDKNDLIIAVSSKNLNKFIEDLKKYYKSSFNVNQIKYSNAFQIEKKSIFEKAKTNFIYIIYVKKDSTYEYHIPKFKAYVYDNNKLSYFKSDNIIIYDTLECISIKNTYINSRDLYKKVYNID